MFPNVIRYFAHISANDAFLSARVVSVPNGNACRFAGDEGSEELPEGVVVPQSQGEDFEELLQDCEAAFSQAAYRHRDLRRELWQEVPALAADDPQQARPC